MLQFALSLWPFRRWQESSTNLHFHLDAKLNARAQWPLRNNGVSHFYITDHTAYFRSKKSSSVKRFMVHKKRQWIGIPKKKWKMEKMESKLEKTEICQKQKKKCVMKLQFLFILIWLNFVSKTFERYQNWDTMMLKKKVVLFLYRGKRNKQYIIKSWTKAFYWMKRLPLQWNGNCWGF